MTTPAQDLALRTFREHQGVLRTSEALRLGIHPRTLYTLRDEGSLERVSRGVYRLAELPPLSDPDLTTVATRLTKAVVCLVSALDFQDMTAEIPRAVSVALPRNAAAPTLRCPPLRVFRFSKAAYNAGVEVHEIDGVQIRVYNPAKTVADCFKFRHKIGIEVAIEALRQGFRDRKVQPSELMDFARICRVQRVIRPYVEALL